MDMLWRLIDLLVIGCTNCIISVGWRVRQQLCGRQHGKNNNNHSSTIDESTMICKACAFVCCFVLLSLNCLCFWPCSLCGMEEEGIVQQEDCPCDNNDNNSEEGVHKLEERPNVSTLVWSFGVIVASFLNLPLSCNPSVDNQCRAFVALFVGWDSHPPTHHSLHMDCKLFLKLASMLWFHLLCNEFMPNL